MLRGCHVQPVNLHGHMVMRCQAGSCEAACNGDAGHYAASGPVLQWHIRLGSLQRTERLSLSPLDQVAYYLQHHIMLHWHASSTCLVLFLQSILLSYAENGTLPVM